MTTLKDLLLENPQIIQKVAADHENFQNTLLSEYNPYSKLFKVLQNMGGGQELKDLYTHLSRVDDAMAALVEALQQGPDADME